MFLGVNALTLRALGVKQQQLLLLNISGLPPNRHNAKWGNLIVRGSRDIWTQIDMSYAYKIVNVYWMHLLIVKTPTADYCLVLTYRP